MKHFFRQYNKKLILWMFFELAYALAMVYWSYFMKDMSDSALGGDGMKGLGSFALFGIGFLAFDLAAEYGRLIGRARFLQAANYGLKNQIFDRIIDYDIHAFGAKNSAGYISLLNNDLPLIDRKVFRILPDIWAQMILAVTAIITMLLFHPVLAVMVVILNVLQLIPPKLFGDRASREQEKYMASLDSMNVKIKDIFSGFEVVKSFGIEDKVGADYFKIAECVEGNAFRMRKEQGRSMAVSRALAYLASVLRMVFSVYLIMQGEISMGILLGVMQISNYVSMPMQSIGELYLEYKTVKPVIARVMATLDGKTEHELSDASEMDLKPVVSAVPIVVEGLSFGYEEGKEVLHNISFRFEKGKKYAVIGNSGSGKSTLIRLLMGYYDFYQGEIHYGDCDQKEADRKSLYQQMSMIHQKVILFEDTLRNNITMYGDYPDTAVWKAIEEAGLTTVVDRMGGGLDFLVEEDGKNLSGGERQRIAIARAFIRQAEVLMMDEGTSSLDSRTAGQVDSLLLKKEGLTLITITHKMNLDLLKQYDEILIMEQGRIWECGHFDQISSQQRKRLEWIF